MKISVRFFASRLVGSPLRVWRAARGAVLPFEKLFLDRLPNADMYETSFMHRDNVSHVVVAKPDFVITASVDGFVKFWKKNVEGIEFVKMFRCHLSAARRRWRRR